jgi:hypothetical protein
MIPTSKSISRFNPVSTLALEECERHYTEVHFPFARQLLRGKPQVVSYHTNRVLRQYDINGGWRQRPTAWRFVILRFEEGRSLEVSEEERRLIADDHLNCLRDLRSCPVAEEDVIDRCRNQTAMAKYLFEFDRSRDTVPRLLRYASTGWWKG